MSAVVELSPEDVLAISTEVWASYLQPVVTEDTPAPSVEDVLTPLPAPVAGGPDLVRAAIEIGGTCRGRVVLELEPVGARIAAARMLGVEPESAADIDDAVGELVNMVGGNIKSLLPQSCVLGLPAVARGGESLAAVPGAQQLCRVDLAWQGQPLRVIVWAHPTHAN